MRLHIERLARNDVDRATEPAFIQTRLRRLVNFGARHEFGRKEKKIGICGQAPSDYPDFAQFLVEKGIDSISLNPDTVLKTTMAIVEKEKARISLEPLLNEP